ncbi:MurR/RpiR family transcriptional regulator [Bermanella sp. R86510]|uniref:MurR/RpiR family transcriptional regulator n=1 Tax=unclassified Bermanella TaxID=2627862 RepID=UPI0037CA2C23
MDRIQNAIPNMRKSEVKVAQYVMQNMDAVLNMRIVDLAQEAQVSEPTIVRFCRAIELNGFQAFKLRLAQSLTQHHSLGQFAIAEDDTSSDIIKKVFDTSINQILRAREQLDAEQMRAATNALTRSRRVEFYGFGASGAVAMDAMHKFFRLEFSAVAYSDPHMQSMSAVTLEQGDVVIAISQSGRTKDLLHAMELAQRQGAHVISLSPPATPVAQLADLPIDVHINEDTDVFTPMTSRIVHLMVIDCLAVGVAQRKGPEFHEHLSRIKGSIADLRLSDQNKPTD